jgi:hypothetical protein
VSVCRSIGGEAVEISHANFRDMSQLCEEFKSTKLARTVRDWEAEHPLIRHELDLAWAALEERLG